ncbi:hypothetical protein KKF91_05410 [Myxococcota bacterium]|nr:hypothetical protein [Myxococcota bacterium]MBU1429986.1 hypothetical protein [Myxococcota bacterium]MBU1898728.1 hypothetical protein [Myxococcota bacterium]
MGLFGVSNREHQRLQDELKSTKAELEAARDEITTARRRLSDKEKSLEQARQAAKTAERKASKSVSGERKAAAHRDKLKRLEDDLHTYQQEMLTARRQLEAERAERLKLEEKLSLRQPEPAPAAPVVEAPAAQPQSDGPAYDARFDERMERLQLQLKEARDEREALKEQVARAEQAARAAEGRLKGEIGKSERVLRELRHNLRSERRAYRILQQQYEAQLDRVRGMEQRFDDRLAEAKASLSGTELSPPSDAARVEDEPKPIAKILPDAAPAE